MFSFINFLQSILKRLKRNKGLWFTLLTVFSVLGVLLSMSLINIMTKDVKHKTYIQVHRETNKQLESILSNQYDTLLAIGGVVAIHPDVIANVKTKSDKSVNDLLLLNEKAINDRLNISPITVRYYASNYKASKSENEKYANLVMETQTSVSGIVVNSVGTRIIAITPIIDNNTTIGAIEISQDISVVKDAFEKLGKEFAFILDKTQLVFIDLEAKQGMTQDIDDQYKIFFHDYNAQFYTNIRKINLDQLKKQKYHVNSNYYTTEDAAVDIDGKEIGMFIIGESTAVTNSFVNITQNLINSITTVALGLVISLILFMF